MKKKVATWIKVKPSENSLDVFEMPMNRKARRTIAKHTGAKLNPILKPRRAA